MATGTPSELAPQPELVAVQPRRRFALWRAASFLAIWAAYAALGQHVIDDDHVVSGDALSRLAHAFFVFHNAPPKLAAIGFVWPPLMTAVFLPLSWATPLATSMVILPITSGFFAALLLLSLEQLLEALAVPRLLRLACVALLGVNPLVVFYACNGMSEIMYLALIVLGVAGFVRWQLADKAQELLRSGLVFGVGTLVRYEVAFWAAAVAVLVPLLTVVRRRGRETAEGLSLAFVAPVVYAVAVWSLVNWMIVGSPLYWVHQENTETFNSATSPGSANGLGLGHVLSTLLSLNWHLFAPVLPVAATLVVVGLARRDLMTLGIAAIVALNFVSQTVLALRTGAHMFEIRYNLRAMPLALIGFGWLFYVCRNRVARAALSVSMLALLLAALPLTWRLMETYEQQFGERAFVRAIATGHSQEGTQSFGVYIGTDMQRQAADWLNRHVHRQDEILTDDSQSYDVMLFSGHPDRFLDRIDIGDRRWKKVLAHPWGRVRYLLVARIRRPDLALTRYPHLVDGSVPGFRRVFANSQWLVFSVARHAPGHAPPAQNAG